jgi:hypothetical protein
VIIWKDPVVAMQRTKSIRLLHKQIVKDAAMSGQSIPDELLTFRKPGENEKPIAGKFDHYVGDDPPKMGVDATRNSINIWQQYASPVWTDINPANTLQFRSARVGEDERHIAPLQLQVIERAMQLWTMLGDIVVDPFAGIGSTGHVALQTGRKFIGFELKKSYYDMDVKILQQTEIEVRQGSRTLFDDGPLEEGNIDQPIALSTDAIADTEEM